MEKCILLGCALESEAMRRRSNFIWLPRAYNNAVVIRESSTKVLQVSVGERMYVMRFRRVGDPYRQNEIVRSPCSE
jgi:hypothetical protein